MIAASLFMWKKYVSLPAFTRSECRVQLKGFAMAVRKRATKNRNVPEKPIEQIGVQRATAKHGSMRPQQGDQFLGGSVREILPHDIDAVFEDPTYSARIRTSSSCVRQSVIWYSCSAYCSTSVCMMCLTP